MGSCIDHLPLAFLLILAATFSLQTEARESRFFSKATRYEPTTKQETTTQLANPKETTTTTTTAATNQDPAKLPQQSTNGYGLYGQGPNYLPPSTTTSSHDADSTLPPARFPNNELAGDGYRSKESNADRATALSSADNELRGAENSEWMQPKYADPSEAYGMSDTRVQENGRYFYDVDNGQRHEAAMRGNYGRGFGYNDVGVKGYEYTNYATENEAGGYNYKNNQESQEYIP